MRWNDSSVVVVELSQSILTTLTKRMQEMKYAIVYFVFLTSVFFERFFLQFHVICGGRITMNMW